MRLVITALGICIILFFPFTIFGMERSDAKKMVHAKNMYKSNIEQIRSWSGNVTLEEYEKGPSTLSEFENFDGEFDSEPINLIDVLFYDDIVTGNSLCHYRKIRSKEKKYHDEIDTLFMQGTSYEISRYLDPAESKDRELSYESKLTIKIVDRANLSRLLSTHFLPIEKSDFNNSVVGALDRYFTLAQESSPEKSSHIKITEIKGRLTIESTIRNHFARYSVDLNRGGMPVEFIAIEDGKGIYWKCQLQKIDGIWIPAETLMINDYPDATREWFKLIWKKNELNISIPKETFSIDSLNLHRGTIVYDYRIDEEYVISDDKYPPLPSSVVPVRHNPYWLSRLILIGLGTILLLAALVRVYLKWRAKHKESRL
jgi:hypothetical protein